MTITDPAEDPTVSLAPQLDQAAAIDRRHSLIPLWLHGDTLEAEAERINLMPHPDRQALADALYDLFDLAALPPAARAFVQVFHPDADSAILDQVSDPVDGWLILDPPTVAAEALDALAAEFTRRAHIATAMASAASVLGDPARDDVDREQGWRVIANDVARLMATPDDLVARFVRAVAYLPHNATRSHQPSTEEPTA